jgi:hypothetical protein
MRPGSPFAAKVIRFERPVRVFWLARPMAGLQLRDSAGLRPDLPTYGTLVARDTLAEKTSARSDSDSLVAEAELIGRRSFERLGKKMRGGPKASSSSVRPGTRGSSWIQLRMSGRSMRLDYPTPLQLLLVTNEFTARTTSVTAIRSGPPALRGGLGELDEPIRCCERGWAR